MKNVIFLFLLLISANCFAQRQPIQGAYLSQNGDTNTLYLLTNNYLSVINYKDDMYLNTYGGPYTYANDKLNITIEYDDANPNMVGQIKSSSIQSNSDSAVHINGETFTKLPQRKQDLDGLWRIHSRVVDNTTQTIPKGDRKTIKLLVDGYFQWIAINPAEKGFYGTGGGKYGFEDKKYTETIVFFSRDNSRIGNDLIFEGEIKNMDWHHRGKSSKGDPIYEIWRKE